MLNFHDLWQRLEEAIEPNPTYGHSNNTKNPHVRDFGSHLDRRLLDKIGGVSTNRSDADYSEDPTRVMNAAEELSRLPGAKGDTARLIHKAIINNPKLKPGLSMPIDQFISMLQRERVRDENGPIILGNLNPEVLKGAIDILATATSTPVIAVSSDATGNKSVTVKQYKANPGDVQRQMARQNAGAKAKGIITDPNEDELAKPGQGQRYSSIKANLAPVSKDKVPDDVKAEINAAKTNFDKTVDIAMHTGTGTALDQAARSYISVLQKYVADPRMPDKAKLVVKAERDRVQGEWEKFISTWGRQNINPQV